MTCEEHITLNNNGIPVEHIIKESRDIENTPTPVIIMHLHQEERKRRSCPFWQEYVRPSLQLAVYILPVVVIGCAIGLTRDYLSAKYIQ